MPAGSCILGTSCQYEKRTLKVARNAFNIGEVWDLVCCHGNKTLKLILCSTFSRTLMQRIKHFCHKLAEISYLIIFDQILVEYLTSHLANLHILKNLNISGTKRYISSHTDYLFMF